MIFFVLILFWPLCLYRLLFFHTLLYGVQLRSCSALLLIIRPSWDDLAHSHQQITSKIRPSGDTSPSPSDHRVHWQRDLDGISSRYSNSSLQDHICPFHENCLYPSTIFSCLMLL
jgi:hypothetical protein